MTSICWVLHIHVLNVSKADVNFASHLSDFHVSYLIWNKSTSVKSSFVAKTIVNLSEIIYDIHTMHYFSVILWSLSLISKTVFKMFIQWYDVMKELTFAAFHDGQLVFYSFFFKSSWHVDILWSFVNWTYLTDKSAYSSDKLALSSDYWLTCKMMMWASQKVVLAFQFFMWTS